MSERGAQLLSAARGQIDELVTLLSTRGGAALALPCPGRERLGDGTVGAAALHTADRYGSVAAFLQAALSGRPTDRQARHDTHHRAKHVLLADLLERLSDARDALTALGGLTDEQLDEVPPASEMRFCDGQRTLDQVLSALLKHQRHQIEALKLALG